METVDCHVVLDAAFEKAYTFTPYFTSSALCVGAEKLFLMASKSTTFSEGTGTVLTLLCLTLQHLMVMEALVFPFYVPCQVLSGLVYCLAVCSVMSREGISQLAVLWLEEWMATRGGKLVEAQLCYGH